MLAYLEAPSEPEGLGGCVGNLVSAPFDHHLEAARRRAILSIGQSLRTARLQGVVQAEPTTQPCADTAVAPGGWPHQRTTARSLQSALHLPLQLARSRDMDERVALASCLTQNQALHGNTFRMMRRNSAETMPKSAAKIQAPAFVVLPPPNGGTDRAEFPNTEQLASSPRLDIGTNRGSLARPTYEQDGTESWMRRACEHRIA